jgi:hypothetical protein
MPHDPAWYARIWEYASSVAGYWQSWLAVAFMMERAFERYFPTLAAKINPYLTSERRRRFFVWIAIIAFVYANFRAFDDESDRLREAQRTIATSGQTRIEELQAQLNAVRWAPLTNDETSALFATVKKLSPQEIVIACETVNGKDLADGVAKILSGIPSWKVTTLHGGGIGIIGVRGIILSPKEDATRFLKDAIESSTKLTVTLGDDSRDQWGTGPALLVVGSRPF